MTARGKVYLVGAGPGDPELLTLKGWRILQQADVIVYDRLVNPELLRHARPDAETLYVGKETERHSIPQEEINRLLIERAQRGSIVCRLKGGDPFLLGRGGEEAAALAAAGIPFEVVPGVTAAIAVPAYAGIPVTCRGAAASVAIVAGQGESATRPDYWDAVARVETLLILMGVERLPAIVAELLARGRAPDTPIALVRWGTYPHQETLVATLGDVVERVRAAGFRRPAVIVVGEVVRQREALAWFERRPLFRRRVLVTRTGESAGELVRRLAELGAEPIEVPLLRFVPLPVDVARLDTGWDWIVFTSANAVRFLRDALAAAGRDWRALGTARLAAIGAATARALAEAGLRVDFTATTPRAEGLLAEFPVPVAGLRLLIPRAREARELLPERWRAEGAYVEILPLYETVPDEAGAARAREAIAAGVDAILLASGSAARALRQALGSTEIGGAKIVCLGPVTADAARAVGFAVAAVASAPEVEAQVAATLAALATG